jgi:hypothetical protein
MRELYPVAIHDDAGVIAGNVFTLEQALELVHREARDVPPGMLVADPGLRLVPGRWYAEDVYGQELTVTVGRPRQAGIREWRHAKRRAIARA